MNKITVIQLLNKIANGEELPNKIKYEGTIYERYEYNNKYYENGDRSRQKDILSEHLANESFYNSGIEIIEEDKEIEEVLEIELLGQCDNWLQKRDVNIKSDFELNPYILEAINRNFKSLYHKQCELIKAVNELKKGK